MCLHGKTDQHRVNHMWLAVVMVFLVCMMETLHSVNSTSNRAIRFNVPSGATTLQDQLVLAQNMCVLGLRGKSCGKSDSILKSGDYNDLLVAGNGYDRWTHQVKPQVIQSRAVSSIDTQVKSIFASMTNPREFFSQIYPINGQSSFFNGLYSHNSGVADIFSRYFEGSFNVHDSQMQYITHQVSSYDSLNATLLFKRIIEILPSNMDEALYQQVIDTFGDSVMTSVEYGGVVDSTVSVRQCFSDGNLESYVKNELSSVVSGSTSSVPDGYARYHKVSQLDVVGGNPEKSSIPERVSTFRNNPVPVTFQTTPIWMVFPEGEKRNNMKAIYDKYVNTKSNMANQMVQELENRKIEEQRKPKIFRAFLRVNNDILQDAGQYELSLGERYTFRELNWLFIYMANSKSSIYAWEGKSPAIIVRHEDSSFHTEVQQYHPEVAARSIPIPPTLSSSTVLNSCASIRLVPENKSELHFTYKDAKEIIICSGGQIMLSGDQRSVVFGCPYVY